MDLKEQNWNNRFVKPVQGWKGIRTAYSPQGEVIDSWQINRGFRSNEDGTEITQSNQLYPDDGRIIEKSWQINKQSHNLADGVFHPANPLMRSLFLEQGAIVWVQKKLEKDTKLLLELIFRHDELLNIRHSVPVVYNGDGNLNRAVSIREDAADFPSNYWSKEINLLPERNLSGNWQGTSVTMTPDLKVSEPIGTQLHWPLAGNKMFFFPDGISLSCPTQVSIGTSFTIAANWLVTDSQLQQLRVNYDNYGAFSGLTLELLHL